MKINTARLNLHTEFIILETMTQLPFAILLQQLKKRVGMKANENLLPLQPGDVLETYADIEDFATRFGYSPKVDIQEGISRFVEWYIKYHEDHWTDRK